jgi:Fungal specific transcription factor domain
VHAMARLAKLASTYEKVASLNCEWTTFNLLPVERLVDELKNWKNEDEFSFQDLEDCEDHEDPDMKRDRFHCSEAWRHAIILYAVRVFAKKQDQRGLQSIDFLSRIILDHIRCIKQEALIQKQVLIPVFLAAAEVGDESDRDFAREYNSNWSSRCRYYMFETAQMILERIWASWEAETRDVYWWGVTVRGGSWSRGRQDHPMASQLLLG